MSTLARRTATLLVALAAAMLPWALDLPGRVPPAWQLDAAPIGRTPDGVQAQAVPLPHRWAADPTLDCAGCQGVWYRFDIERPDLQDQPQIVLLPAPGRNAALYLNGQLIAQGGRLGGPGSRLGARTLAADTSPAQWGPGLNRLYVLALADPPSLGRMPPLALGPQRDLAGVRDWRRFATVTVAQAAAFAATLVALMLAAVWQLRRQEPAYARLALTAGLIALHGGLSLVVELPCPAQAWEALLAALAVASAAAMWHACGLLHERPPFSAGARPRSAGLPWPPRATLPGWIAAAATLALWVGVDLGLSSLAAAGLAPLAVTAAAGVRAAWQGWSRRDASALVAGTALAAAASHDALGWPLGGASLPALPWAAMVWLGVAAWMLLRRFVRTLDKVELLRIDLEALVAARTAELQAQFDRVRELERQQVLANERERLMRDMHDGVGGHLVSMLAMIEADRRRPGELATVVRDALTDMRLMIDSLEPVDDDLNAVLAMLHDRLSPRLRASGVQLNWDVDLLPPTPGLTPSRVLHVMRVLQEAVTNALRHGHARSLWLAAHPDGSRVRITLRDDGAGFDPAVASAGRGLKNMQRRAVDAAVEVSVASAPGQGTTVSLTIGC